MDVSIIIVNWNTRDLLLDCLAALYDTVKGLSIEVLMVDNASKDDSVDVVREKYPQLRIIRNDRNLGFAAGNNKGLRVMQGKYALLLSTDTVLTEGAVHRLFTFLEGNEDAAMACGQLLNSDGSKQNSIANFPSPLSLLCNETILRLLFPAGFPSKRREYTKPITVDSCIGACLMVRKQAMEEVGLLDERYFVFMEETDWALSMHKAGWKSCFVPDAKIYHLQGQSAGHNVKARKMFYRSRYLYFRKWFPKVWLLMSLLVVLRLVNNVILNIAGMILTLGLHRGIRGRLELYLNLFFWHLQGCPE
ncbi:MAG: glycosyltransferase family 2 protein [Proteobacteria bacterium]|nr:glycosyltransferase family 2 protein [Pseudomonadota bacterium]MBU1739807.1 glycosyltransferase family 2 protein [Pseudomonadota bacterium]